MTNETLQKENESFKFEIKKQNELNKDKEYFEVIISGRFEVINNDKLNKNFIEMINESDIKKLVLNFKDVDFINSLGLNFLIEEYNKCKKKNIKLYISHCEGYVLKVLSITRLDTILKLINKSEDCLREDE